MTDSACPDQPITFAPIGVVENSFDERTPAPLIRAQPSRIVLRPDLVAGLTGLQPGQRLLVLFHFDRIDNYDLLQHPRGDYNRPKRGVFTLRSPRRPAPIGATVVEVEAIDGNVLTVTGLDALNGTPVLDLKPE